MDRWHVFFNLRKTSDIFIKEIIMCIIIDGTHFADQHLSLALFTIEPVINDRALG